ncbi:MAG: hypothetical protein V7K47_07255 [Nostoc sp.]
MTTEWLLTPPLIAWANIQKVIQYDTLIKNNLKNGTALDARGLSYQNIAFFLFSSTKSFDK